MSRMIEHLHAIRYAPIHPDTELPEGYLDTLEDALGCGLPEDYLEFVRAFPLSGGCYAGASIDLAEGQTSPWGSTLEYSTLLGHETRPSWGLVAANRDDLDHRVEDMIIIGDDIAGNFLYMGVNGTGGVYFMDRDKDERMTREEMCFVRPSFEAFILDTYTDPEEWFEGDEAVVYGRRPPRRGLQGAWDRLRRAWWEFW